MLASQHTTSARTSVQPTALEDFLGQFQSPYRGSDYWLVCCPAHDDREPSLSIKEGRDGRVLLKCHAGCETLDILDALGATWQDLFPYHLRYAVSREDLAEHVFKMACGECCPSNQVWNAMLAETYRNILEFGQPGTMFSWWFGAKEYGLSEKTSRYWIYEMCDDGDISVIRRMMTYRYGRESGLWTRIFDLVFSRPIEALDGSVTGWMRTTASQEVARLKEEANLYKKIQISQRNPANGSRVPISEQEGMRDLESSEGSTKTRGYSNKQSGRPRARAPARPLPIAPKPGTVVEAVARILGPRLVAEAREWSHSEHLRSMEERMEAERNPKFSFAELREMYPDLLPQRYSTLDQ